MISKVNKSKFDQNSKVEIIDINRIKTVSNPRTKIDKNSINDLADSIKTHGILQPVLVSQINGSFRLISGERRLRAAKIAGVKEIPALVRNINEDQLLDVQIEENLQRQDLNPMEEAIAIKNYIENKDIELEELSARLNKSVQFLKERLKLTELHKRVQKLLLKEEMTFAQAKIMATLSRKDQIELLNSLNEEGCAIHKMTAYEFQRVVENDFMCSLNNVSFDKQDCLKCLYRSDAQLDFFDSPETIKSKCLNRICFNKKLDEQTKKKLEKCEKRGNKILTGEEYIEQENSKKSRDFGIGKPYNMSKEEWKECLGCEQLGAYESRHPYSSETIGRICLNKRCFNLKTKTDSSNGNGHDKEAILKKRLNDLRRKWLHDITEKLLQTKAIYRVVLALCDICYNHEHTEIFKKHGIKVESYATLKDAVRYVLLKMPKNVFNKLDALLRDVLAHKVKNIDYDDDILIEMAKFHSEKYENYFIIDEDFLNAHTKDQLHDLAVEIGFDKFIENTKDVDSKTEKDRRKRWRNLSKKDLVEMFLNSGFDLKGVVPKVIKNME